MAALQAVVALGVYGRVDAVDYLRTAQGAGQAALATAFC